MKLNYKMRAVQMDLARQMETVPFIKGFIDFIAENHYNTLFLYLEWRVRTKTFDIGKKEGYSAEELAEIVEYAAVRGIDVIPGLATLGHAELILEQQKFASYSERREGIPGRFGDGIDHVFCPSLPETRRFLESYLSEVAAIFPKTPYLHVGGDEAWDFVLCSKCRDAVRTFDDEQKLYLDHFKFIHKVVKKLGKRMMLWDDMFEYYEDILPEMPRDIIMVDWQYQKNVRGYLGHFCNLVFYDIFSTYDKLGFDYLTAPADFCWSNISTSTAHGDNYKPMGGLLTSWEKSTSLLYKYFPSMAAAGQLWSGTAPDADSAMALGVKQLFGIGDDCFRNAVSLYAEMAHRVPSVSLKSLTGFPFFGLDNTRLPALQTAASVFMQYSGKLKDTRAEIVLADILGDCILKILEARSRFACWKLFQGQPGESFDDILAELEDAGKKYMEFCAQHRRRSDAKPVGKMLESWKNALLEVKSSLKTKGVLTVLFALPDGYGAENTKIFVRSNGREIQVAEGCFKVAEETFFEFNFFLPKNMEVEAVRVEATGFSGEGIAYVSARTAKGTFIPSGVTNAVGTVEHPEFILKPNVNYAFLGMRDSLEQFRDRAKAKVVNSIEVAMKKA
ncbi:MAG: Beta-hexosaminidase [Lentisphaerae bacterium ADurb.Bin242]|nr:MAG: Beta-hexosaminidase [Lentisphaerae bacterium ADurb.Bin242]